MATTPQEKIQAILDKLPIPEAIEVYHKLGEKLHSRIEEQKLQAEQQLKSLKKES